mmetsp:Transcript_1807/g.4014  ORF Transcript_1807/g.4014 Transcript_1807/m.4014 type:complete len:636 (+) Transcript_1807:125-2032(+)
MLTPWAFMADLLGCLGPSLQELGAGDAGKAAPVEGLHAKALYEDAMCVAACLVGYTAACLLLQCLSAAYARWRGREASCKPSSIPSRCGKPAPLPSPLQHDRSRVTAVSVERGRSRHGDSSCLCESAEAPVARTKDMRPTQRVVAVSQAICEEGDALVAAVRRGDAAELPRLLDEARARATTAGRTAVAETAQLFLSALRACASWRCFDEALVAYDHVAKHLGTGLGSIWSLLLYSAVEAGEFHRCEAFFAKLCFLVAPSGHDFVNVVRYYAHSQDLLGLRCMLANLHRSGYRITAHGRNRALAACVAIGGGALQVAEALAEADACSEAIDAVTYNTLMKGHARAGKASRCFELYREMQAKGLSPSDMTFGTLLNACHESYDFERAKEIFKDLCDSGLQVNVIHYTTFMKSLVRAGLLKDAAEVLTLMLRSPASRPDLMTYSMLIKAHADHGDVAGASQILQQMLRQGVQPDAIVLNMVLSGCCARTMESRNIYQVLHWLIRQGLRPSSVTLSILVKALAGSGAWDEALEALAQAPQRFQGLVPEARLYVQLAQACARAGVSGWALQAYAAMIEAAAVRGAAISETASTRLLKICIGCGEAVAAQKLHSLVCEAPVGRVMPGAAARALASGDEDY